VQPATDFEDKNMDNAEIHAKAVIAAALITSHAVEIPRIPTARAEEDAASIRLRDLTDYVYNALICDRP
jgi:hypothetical protein